MLGEITQAINLSANSTIDNVPVLYMAASINTRGEFGINQSIRDSDLYFANFDEVNADYIAFVNKVKEIAGPKKTN